MGRSTSHGEARARSCSGSSSRLLSSSLASQAVAEDLAATSMDEPHAVDVAPHPSSHGMYRRLSGVAYGAARPVFNPRPLDEPTLTPLERKQSRDAERSLLRDNHVLPPKHDLSTKSQTLPARVYRHLFSTKLPQADEEHDSGAFRAPTETSPLLYDRCRRYSDEDAVSSEPSEILDEQWEEAVASGRLRTTWQRESKTVLSYSGPLIVTFLLQYSIQVAGVFIVGRIGTIELGAVSLANMSSAITCMAPFQGLATSLDTLCAQAYGSGNKHLVGLQCQRMATFLLCLSLPVAVLWVFSESILVHVVPNPESARLASLYLRILIPGIPGLVLFETGKRFLQAQGLFRATTIILLFAAPIHVFLLWFMVWKLQLGYIGAPIATVITQNLLPTLLVLYVRFYDGMQCWGGFSKRAFVNWWTMIRLALPGLIMVEAEWLAFEILTIVASLMGTEYLAAQSVLTTLASISYQIPFPVSIAASTRVANLIGAGLVDAAKMTAKVTFAISCTISLLNLLIFSSLRFHLPLLFTNDEEVILIAAQVLPFVAVLQVFDGLGSGAHGLLRGIGKQAIGGPANLLAYYVISLPISLSLTFAAGWKLQGLWSGLICGLISVSLIEYAYLLKTDWHKAAAEASARNQAE